MAPITNALAAFQAAAGVSADKLSWYVRLLVLALTFLWATWCMLGEVHHFRHHDIEVYDVMRAVFRILVVVVLVMVLVFI